MFPIHVFSTRLLWQQLRKSILFSHFIPHALRMQRIPNIHDVWNSTLPGTPASPNGSSRHLLLVREEKPRWRKKRMRLIKMHRQSAKTLQNRYSTERLCWLEFTTRTFLGRCGWIFYDFGLNFYRKASFRKRIFFYALSYGKEISKWREYRKSWRNSETKFDSDWNKRPFLPVPNIIVVLKKRWIHPKHSIVYFYSAKTIRNI